MLDSRPTNVLAWLPQHARVLKTYNHICHRFQHQLHRVNTCNQYCLRRALSHTDQSAIYSSPTSHVARRMMETSTTIHPSQACYQGYTDKRSSSSSPLARSSTGNFYGVVSLVSTTTAVTQYYQYEQIPLATCTFAELNQLHRPRYQPTKSMVYSPLVPNPQIAIKGCSATLAKLTARVVAVLGAFQGLRKWSL